MSSIVKRIGDLISNFTTFDSSGKMIAYGDAEGLDDVYPTGVSVNATGPNGPSFTAYNGNLKAYEFVGTGVQFKEIHMTFQFPHTRRDGSEIHPHVHLYVRDNAIGGDVKFGFEYTWTSQGGIESAPVTIYDVLTVPPSNGNRGNEILYFPMVDGAGQDYSSLVTCRIFRYPSDDTLEASVWLKSADIHAKMNKLGT